MSRPCYRGRDIHGVLLLDKPQGLSSNETLQKVKRIFRANRAGHTGALDPLATGMLPICLGEATKFSQYLLNADKRYCVIARLGERTDTSDSNGKIIRVRPIIFNKSHLYAILNSFRGKIQQVPSMYSALKYHGRPLYEYARHGIEVTRKARTITVYELQFIYLHDNELKLEIHCSKGTYIRTIIDELGEKLGCGAHVIMLRRIQVANFPIEKMVTLKQLYTLQSNLNSQAALIQMDALLMPISSPAANYPEVNLSIVVANNFKHGQSVKEVSINLPKSSLARVTEGKKRKFIGMAEITDDGHVVPRRLTL